jgi:hypothetical protein
MIKKIFSKDWPENDPMKQSSLQYTKIFAAFVKLLDQFIKESLDWGQIEAELKKIRLHVLQIQSLSHDYTGVVFAISVKEIPDRGDTIRQSYEFFNRNRSVPTKLSDF